MDDSSIRYVFVYGTLLPGLAPAVIASTVARMRVVGAATVAGWLYDLGAYPGCVVEEGCGGVIHGQLLEVPAKDAAGVLGKLDWYEGYAAHDEAGRDLFVRRACEARLADGSLVRAWVYVYGRELGGARRIEGGRYRR
jgi:gamma-glutamylcyclotransferase (GGCT)/AIG2-like uncharacterized protein YtfP